MGIMRLFLTSFPRIAALGLALGILLAEPAKAYSPTDPKVQAMVGQARQYLSQAKPATPGEAAAVALGLIKSGSDGSDPKVQEAVAAIRQGLQNKGQLGSPINYNVAISIIFLIELDPIAYRSEAQGLLDILLKRQESHGGWSYWPGEGTYGREVGDTSMTQYGTLALWEAKRAKFSVPLEACERLADFWCRSQTPQGAWGYQARLAPPGQKMNQDIIRRSTSLGGLGSAYVIGELFGLAKKDQDERKLSNSLQKVSAESDTARYFTPRSLDLGQLRQTISLGNRYVAQMHRGYDKVDDRYPWFTVFYMYSMERYRSFQELYEGKSASDAWYDEGVEFLEKTQKPDGSWTFGKSGHMETPFAVMFLMRSTKRSIEREFGQGLVRGGRGLPSDIGQVVLDEASGAVINPEAADTVKQLLAVLEDPKNSNLLAMASKPASLDMLVRPAQDEDEVAREQRIQSLKDLVSAGAYQQRVVAVKALGRTGELDQAPLLLYALTDPDPRVVRAADEALRFISRKFNGFGPVQTDDPEALENLRRQWRDWYLSLRPDAEFLE
jgi:hypothetical protein